MANPDSVSQYYLDSFGNGRIAVKQATAPVSYTHLTLPTIYSV